MSQLLSFAFKRRRPTDEDNRCPGVIASQSSSDTTTTPPMVAFPHNENYICIPRRRGVATITPEGLLPRRPLAEIRAELLPDEDLQIVAQNPPSEQKQQQHLAVLPKLSVATSASELQSRQQLQLPTRPSRSWSTRSSSFRWSAATSPLSNRNSSPSSTSHWTAASPNLVPGQARTAVGNLVALQQRNHSKNNNNNIDPPGLQPPKWSPSSLLMSPPEKQPQPNSSSMFSPLSNPKLDNTMVLDHHYHHPSTEVTQPSRRPSRSSLLFSPVISEKSNSTRSTKTGVSRTLVCSQIPPATSSSSSQYTLDPDIQRIKARNQHQAKEELCLQIVERLQDNIDLVTKIDGLFPWFGSSTASGPPQHEDAGSFLTGIAEEQRYQISDQLDLLLNELNNGVQTEEFFLSPSKVPEYGDTNDSHSELRKAISFCKVLVQMAVPPAETEEDSIQGTNEVGRWRFLYAEEIGLDVPQTPSSSSNFWPAEAVATTPMTSNVSLGASTLTSRPHMLAPTTAANNGLDLRHALQTFVTAIRNLSDACQAFCHIHNSGLHVHSAGQHMKQSYQALVGGSGAQFLDVVDLKCMVDAFEFVVTEDDDDDDTRMTMIVESSSPVMRAATLGSGRMDTTASNASSSLLALEDDDSSSSADPHLEQVGSIDYSCEEEDEEEYYHQGGIEETKEPVE